MSKREWAPRIWQGMDFFGWMRLLGRNRFAVRGRHLYYAVVLTLVSPFHTLLRGIQQLTHGRRVARTEVSPPLFIVGHWRTGTTLLHELLACDPRLAAPTTYECLVPNHFLLTEPLGRLLLRPLLPPRRPMDEMAVGWERPQEDEFALCNLGMRSPYLTIAFPNRPPQNPEYHTLAALSPRARRRWEKTFLRFLRQITLLRRGRLVLKSPFHTFRLGVLLDLFPEARFVHLVRHPDAIYPSTLHLWRRLQARHGFQEPRYEGLEEEVFSKLVEMYEAFDAHRPWIAASHLHELRYEDLVADPLTELQKLYRALDLGDFETARPGFEVHLKSIAGYRPNRYRLSEETRAEIRRRWAFYFERYGYD